MRYGLFAGSTYYPLGGFKDFAGFFESIQLALDVVNTTQFGENNAWWHVVDLSNGQIVAKSR